MIKQEDGFNIIINKKQMKRKSCEEKGCDPLYHFWKERSHISSGSKDALLC